MTDGRAAHEQLHILAGAFVLGGLSEAEHRSFAAHLRQCRDCQREIGELGGLPRLLDLAEEPDESTTGAAAPPSESWPVATPGDGTSADVTELVSRLHRRRRASRIRWSAAAAVLAVALAGGGAALGVAAGRASSAPTTAVNRQVAMTPTPGVTVTANLSFVPKAWGTEVHLDGAALPTSGELALWVRDGTGQTDQIATWHGTEAGRALLVAACSRHLPELRSVEIRTRSGQVLATASV